MGGTDGEVSKKLMPRRRAVRTAARASSGDTWPKTLPRGEAPNPTQLSMRPVFPNSLRSSFVGVDVAIGELDRIDLWLEIEEQWCYAL